MQSFLRNWCAVGGLTGMCIGIYFASFEIRAGGREVNWRAVITRALVVWGAAPIFAILVTPELTPGRIGLAIVTFPQFVYLGWILLFTVVSAREVAEEVPLNWYFFRRDLPKNRRKLMQICRKWWHKLPLVS